LALAELPSHASDLGLDAQAFLGLGLWGERGMTNRQQEEQHGFWNNMDSGFYVPKSMLLFYVPKFMF
jgi:hypothetical protein